MRQGIDTVEISRIEKLISDLGEEGLRDFFSETELADAGTGKAQAQKLAARFAAKEACCKLFPKEICLGTIEPVDFAVVRDGYGKPTVEPSEKGRAVMDLHLVEDIDLSLTHTESTATAIASTEIRELVVPWYGKLAYYILPIRRKVVLENLNRVFGETLSTNQIVAIAQQFYAHYLKCFGEFLKMPFLSESQKKDLIRIEGGENLEQGLAKGKGVLILTGHFGSWEVATVAGISQFTEFRGRFHFIRRPLKPKWFNDFVMRRFRQAGFGTLDKAGSLDDILDLLEGNEIVVSIFDQFTIKKYGILSEFFGHQANTFKSLSVLAQFTGAPVIPSSSWREPDGTHVLKFGKPVEVVTEGRTRDIIKKNTKRFNEALEKIILRHPEQWIWMHKRWKKIL
ncbi:MAG: 4'-phosphopantetheinyl transferase superfamily protein [Verrucomicrobiales bacterium]|jgi:KDO2-lipid IV(A) lauroyltransferase|nr:4'-phosphopantetheinyl transferase superfamily protein [Verrucomicrobiales bacterium]